VEADQEVSEVQGAVSAARKVDELFQWRDELAVVDLLDRCLDVGVVDESASGAHRQEAFVAIAGQAAWRRHWLPRSRRAASSAGTALRNGRMRERPWRCRRRLPRR
jgi:hypothetical protein